MVAGILFHQLSGARVVMTRNIVELRQLSKLYTILVPLMETQTCHRNPRPQVSGSMGENLNWQVSQKYKSK